MSLRGPALSAALTLACGAWPHAEAQEFHLYLACSGKVIAGGKQRPVHLDLALRDNNETALIQRSNVLPVGERLRYRVSPMAYSMVYKAPVYGTQAYRTWSGGWLWLWQPDLKRLATIRLSIDRQSGQLEGQLLNAQDQDLGALEMACEPQDAADLPPPKF